MQHRTRTTLLGLVAVFALFLVGAPLASAASCNIDAIYNDAYDGTINGTYSIACLQKAVRDETSDIRTYSNVDAVIKAAISKQQYLARYRSQNANQHDPTPAQGGTTSTATTTPSSSGGAAGGSKGGGSGPKSSGPGVQPAGGGHPRSDGANTILDPPSSPGVATRLLAGQAPPRADEVPGAVILLGALTALFLVGGLASYLLRRRLAARSSSAIPPA